MQITVIGAAGFVGSRVVTEAVARGHDVTAVVRDGSRAAVVPAGVRVRSGDAADIADVTTLGDGQDAVVAATRPPAGRESELVATTKALLAGLAGTGARLVVVGGAGSLAVPGSGRLVAEDADLVEPDYRGIARAGVRQLAACRAAVDVDWTYLSPPAAMLPGVRTGRYRLGGDELLVDGAGRSAISVEDMAVALVDEIEMPAHRRVRFTVAY